MELRIMVEPQQGTTYDRLLALARRAEQLGFGGFFSSDHYQRIGDGDPGPGPLDAWTTLAGLARDTERLRLGTLVTPVTFRLPGPLAVAVAQVDHMSGGRVELSLGAGWNEDEHVAHGIPFHDFGTRFDMLAEQLAIVTGLWATPPGETFTFEGTHHTVIDHPALPRPAQTPRPPLIMGGHGPKRSPRLAARYADEFNVPFATPDVTGAQGDRVREACEASGRDPATMVLSAAQGLCCGADDTEVARRAAAIDRDVEELRAKHLGGTPAELVDKLGTFAEAGVSRVYLQVLDDTDLDHLDLVAAEVAPHVAD